MKKLVRKLLTKLALNTMFGMYIEEFNYVDEKETCVVTDSWILCKAEF